MTELACIVEALLFLSNEPVSVADLAEACDVQPGEVEAALAELRERDGGLVLREEGRQVG